MQQKIQPIEKELVLIGGGHSHAIALLMFGMKPLSGVRLTLITEASDTPYSGMIPGHIAGFYSHDECHIQLRQLANFAKAHLYITRVVDLDLENQKVICANGLTVDFDVLSINIGSTPATISVPGASEYAIGAKPASKLLEHWYKFCENIRSDISHKCLEKIRIGIVGGGAGGVELALAMQSNLESTGMRGQRGYLVANAQLEIHLFHRDGELMPSFHQSARHRVKEILTQRGIELHLGENVCGVEQNLSPLFVRGRYGVICQSGLMVECDRVFWVTQASAPEWLKTTGLLTDEQGFILVGDTLQSLSHQNIFATGDIATMVNHPRPKAGVFAVRQGKPLFENLQRFCLGKSLKPFKPQKSYLSLIGTGDQKAIAIRGAFTSPPHKLLWHWKDWIDRRFMGQFNRV
jgi:selenide, water dikinase